MIHDFKVAHSLGTERGELPERTIRDDFGNYQLLELDHDLVVQFILQVIFRDTYFSSKVQEFRKEIVKLVGILHVELSKLVLHSGHSVWVIIDGLQMLNHVGRIFIWV